MFVGFAAFFLYSDVYDLLILWKRLLVFKYECWTWKKRKSDDMPTSADCNFKSTLVVCQTKLHIFNQNLALAMLYC